MLDLSTPMGIAIWHAKGLESVLFEDIRSLTVAGGEDRERLFQDCKVTIESFRRLNETSFDNNELSQLRLTELENTLASLARAELIFEALADLSQCNLCGEALAGLYGQASARPFCHRCFGAIMPAIEAFQPGFHLDYDA